MGFNVTVTPQVQEVEISATVQPYEVQVTANQDLVDYVNEAKQSADEAEASAILADNSADSALASATSATASASSASASASSASSSASTATTQAGIATTKANEASQSASNALASEQASAISEGNALASEQASAQSEANALQSEQNALASEQASALSASNALASENSASASASTATTQAGIATTQAGIATTQAGNALTSANNAAASAAAAAQTGTSTLLTGFSVGANTAIAATDSILTAFNKTQGQINARVTGTGVAGQVSFWSGASAQSGDSGLRWDNTGKVLGIKSSPDQVILGSFRGGLQINDSSANASIIIQRLGNNEFQPRIVLGKSRGTTLTSTVQLQVGDVIGELGFYGVGTNNTLQESCTIQAIASSIGSTVVSNIILSANNFAINTTSPTNTLDVNGTARIRNGVSLADISGNVAIGTTTDAGFRLDVNGTTRLNGLQTFQGTTASDTAPLGSELTTTGSGTNWTGTGFATGYTHVVGSTAPLTTSTPAVSGTYYQIAYTVTGRTAGSFTIGFGGFLSGNLTATGATGPLASSTANLEIVPTTDFDGTIVLSIRSIGNSSATTTINDSGGNSRIQIRAITALSNTLIGLNSGSRITTGFNNSFFGVQAGQNNTTGGSNSFFGVQAGRNNTTGGNNSFYGFNSGFNNTTGGNNSFFGRDAGQNNTTGGSNSFFGRDAGRYLANGSTALTIANNSVFLGVDTRANADNETNQIVIGHTAIGLGSNTTVIGNSSTTFGRWWGNLLIGTSTNVASSALTVESTTKGFLPPRMTTAQRDAIASPVAGLVIYNTSTNKHQGYDGTNWNDFY
jgi:hypothetical protein